MNRRIPAGRWMGLSIVCFGIMSASFLLMPLIQGPVSGLMFWGGLILGCVCQWALRPYKGHGSRKWGAFTFFTGKLGRIVDTLLILAAVATAAALAMDGYGYICYVLMAATAFALSMHCIVNSITFANVMGLIQDHPRAKDSETNMKKGGKRTR